MLTETHLKTKFKSLDVKSIKDWQYVQLMAHGNTVLNRDQYKKRETIIKELDKVGLYVLIYESEHGTHIMVTKERNEKTLETKHD